MTQREFETRVKMTVSSKEYEAIEIVYMQSDLDKDEFCKVWKSMNKSRVQRAKELRMQEEREERLKRDMYNILTKVDLFSRWDNLAVDFLSEREQDLLGSNGIYMQMDNGYGVPMLKICNTVAYEIKEYLGLV